MVALFGRDARVTSRIATACPPGTPLELFTDWSALARHVHTAECVVVWLEWLGCVDDFTHLLELRARLPGHPIVLITVKDADNARHLKDLMVEEVLWQEEVPHALWGALARASARGVLGRVAQLFLAGPTLPLPLRRALVHACRVAAPVHTVSQLAGAAGCDRRTLWRHWRDANDGRSAPALQDVLDWLLLLRAVGRKTAGICWRVIAEELGVHEHTMGRIGQRLTGETLRGLAEHRVDWLLLRFTARVLVPVLRMPAPAGAAKLGERRMDCQTDCQTDFLTHFLTDFLTASPTNFQIGFQAVRERREDGTRARVRRGAGDGRRSPGVSGAPRRREPALG